METIVTVNNVTMLPGIAIDPVENKLYYSYLTSPAASSIWSCNLDGSNNAVFKTLNPFATVLAVAVGRRRHDVRFAVREARDKDVAAEAVRNPTGAKHSRRSLAYQTARRHAAA